MWIVARFSPFEWEIATNTKVKRVSRRVREYYVDDCNCDDDNHDIHEQQHQPHNNNQCCTTSNIVVEDLVHSCEQRYANEYFNNYRSSYVRDFHSSESFEEDEDETSVHDGLIEHHHHQQQQHQQRHPLDDNDCSNEGLNHLSGFIDECTNESEIELTTFHNDFTLINSFWYTIGTLMAGSDLHPKVFMHENFQSFPSPRYTYSVAAILLYTLQIFFPIYCLIDD